MIQKQLTLLVFFVGISIFGYGQKAPGYLGKRLSIGGNFQLSPAILNPNNNGNKGLFKFNTQFGVTAEYATNRHASILLHYQTYSTLKDYDEEVVFFDLNNNYYDNSKLFGDLKVASYGFELRSYSESIAPYGYYLGIGLNYKVIELTQPMAFSSTTLVNRPQNDSPYTMINLNLTLGKQRIYLNKIIVSTGINIGIPLEFSKLNLLSTLEDDFTYNESDHVQKRIVLHDLLNFKIGVRYLLF
ncbi:hypothetical protein GYB57_00540 [bacterium]|nr:hypothetical protein [bacterium]